MITGRLIDQFAARGFDQADAAARASLVERAAAALLDHTTHRATWAWFVPGRIEVIGKHTDYAGGRSLIAAVPRGLAVVASPRDDQTVTAADAASGDRVEIDLAGGRSTRVRGWASYVSVVARRLAGNFEGAPFGLSIAFASDLPRAAGLSSSSALVVASAFALIRRARLDTRDDWRRAMPDRLALAGYLGAIERGSTFGPLTGASGVGTHGGSEDHTAIVNARAGVLSAYSYVPVRHLEDVPTPPEWRFIAMTSGIRADKAGSARGRYNRAALAGEALRDLYNSCTGRDLPTLAAVLETGPAAGADLRRWVQEQTPAAFDAGALTRRLAHFERENARVLEMAGAIRRADEAVVGQLAAASQRDAAELLGNQMDETNRLAALAREAGAFAATSFGAGFGGSVWALAHADAVRVAQTWRRRYLDATPAVRDVEWFLATPSPGAFEIDL